VEGHRNEHRVSDAVGIAAIGHRVGKAPRSGVTTSAKPELLLGDVWFTPNDADGNDGRKAPQDKSTETAVVEDVDHPK
jgi:hypothetical protein